VPSSEPLRVVLDANVLFSGCAFESGNSRKIINYILRHKVCLVTCTYIISEVVEHLLEKDKQTSIPEFYRVLAEGYLETVESPSRDDITANLYLVPADPKDVPVVLTAINSHADCIISGDHHLNAGDVTTQAIDTLIRVFTPHDFLDTMI